MTVISAEVAVVAPHAAQTHRRPGARVPALDLLRFVAAFAVVLYHYSYGVTLPANATQAYSAVSRVAMHGYLGVNLFFMISGFVILLTARVRRPSEFVTARVARLYPEFWICVLLTTALLLVTGRPPAPAMLAANLTMLPALFGQQHVDGVYWTLEVEVKFYALVWALSVTRQLPRVEKWLYAWLAVTAALAVSPARGVLQELALFPYAPLFIAGCLLYLLREDGTTPGRIAALAGCMFLAMMLVSEQQRGFNQAVDINPARMWEARLVIAFWFAVLAVAALHRGALPFANAVTMLGVLTYPLYLSHNIAKVFVLKPLAEWSPAAAMILAIAASLALAATVSTVVERRIRRPFQDLLRRVLVRSSRGAQASTWSATA